MIYMHLHGKSPAAAPFRPHRLDARKFRHRHFRSGAGGHVERTVGRTDVSIRDAGLLITFGAIVLCIGSPLTAWLTSRIERHTLLTATLAVLALANVASAFAPDYASLLVIRLLCSRSARSIRRRPPAPPR